MTMNQDVREDKTSNSQIIEHVEEDFDEKVNLLQHDEDGSTVVSQSDTKEVENIFSQVNESEARRPSLTNTQQIEIDTQQKEIPFDFNRFVEQMRSRTAKPIKTYYKSFLQAFNRRPWTTNEQIKIIQDFLEFIYIKMRENDIWRGMSDQEFSNAKEGMEKLVMNRLYSATFCSTTTDDKERDEILHQKISIFRWIREKHLDIPETEHNENFLKFAESELLKINNYKAPRDKLICILNCCKIIFGLIKQVEGDAGADKFLPILIYVIIRANPNRLVSNAQYIYRFRCIDQLQAEQGYYLTNLMGAIAFIESMEAKSLSISKEEFDSNIEKTMNELKIERPMVHLDKAKVDYENALYPSHSSNPMENIFDSSKAALLERGNQFAQKIQKPLNMIGRLFQGMTPTEETRPPLPPRPSTTESMTQQDKDLQTLYDMFPNTAPDVCRIIFNASGGVLPDAIDRLLEI
ncbi:hypothetical protein BY458DRAFT_508649 [Sporodiniella umbellata]|nr:hypothetical protein BY458DRAFT_508649 [Sporodiniella umbellata]